MEKDLKYVELFEIYKGLLTKKQRETFVSHYHYDLSLAEIAEEAKSTRQGVSDIIRSVKKKLDELEKEIGKKRLIDGISDAAEKLPDGDCKQKLITLIGG